MRHIYFIFFVLFLGHFSTAQVDVFPKGYIHTKNDYHLTGSIGNVEHTTSGSMVLFVNDFGTPYYIHPAWIKGFAFYEGPAMKAYESKFWEDKWMFLSVQYAGDNIRLLKTPDKLLQYSINNGQLTTRETRTNKYWLELPGHRIEPVKRLGFRRQMKKLVRDVSPSFAAKIGKKGYRFKNLYTILDEYDKAWSKGKRQL